MNMCRSNQSTARRKVYRVSVEPGFDAYGMRLSGNDSSEPPFSGTLRHRGWRAARVELPKQVGADRDESIIVAAEIEIA